MVCVCDVILRFLLMEASRIAELLQPFLESAETAGPCSLGENQLKHISIYIDILLRWNARVNLTAVRLPEDIVTRHFGESLFAARHLFPGAAEDDGMAAKHTRVFDVGSGAGFPGLPIKIWAPEIKLTLIESNQKKATFLREAVRALGLTDVSVYAGRSEQLVKEAKGSADVVTLRAVERFETALPVAADLVRPGGVLALLIGEIQVAGAASLLGDLTFDLFAKVPLSEARVLLVGRKH
jgi:16S rRNA (guanine527-N7)-methyltransferase